MPLRRHIRQGMDWAFGNTEHETMEADNGHIRQQSNSTLYAAEFDGDGPDERLSACLSHAENGDTVMLERSSYTQDREIGQQINIVGSGAFRDNGSRIRADWTVTDIVNFREITLGTASTNSGTSHIYVDAPACRFMGVNLGQPTVATIQVRHDFCHILGAYWGSVVFETGTSQGVLDASTRVEVTDNGSNTIGDIA